MRFLESTIARMGIPETAASMPCACARACVCVCVWEEEQCGGNYGLCMNVACRTIILLNTLQSVRALVPCESLLFILRSIFM